MSPCADHGLKGNAQGYGRVWVGIMATARKYQRDTNVIYQITSGRTYKDVI